MSGGLWKKAIGAVLVPLPWSVKRIAMTRLLGYDLHPTARIGWSLVCPGHLLMAEGARIGHLNVLINLESVRCGENAIIDRGNWITGHSKSGSHFKHRLNRDSSLVLGAESAITRSHIIDCTDRVEVGSFTTIAGYGSQLITHGIDIAECRQDCRPISIGSRCLLGTRVIVLGGSRLPSNSVLAAASLLNKEFDVEFSLYAGQPAQLKAALDAASKYFTRASGFVS